MKRNYKRHSIVLYALVMICLILDSKTVVTGASEGLKLCMNSVVPSLFPFLLVSLLLNNALSGIKLNFLHPIGRIWGIPKGAESLLLLGLVGGYPVGAHCINEAYRTSNLDRQTAHRLMGFCGNAGPAFLFGMMSSLFTETKVIWYLWIIHILSALIVGIILPTRTNNSCSINDPNPITLSEALRKSICTMGEICSWVIIFRVLLAFLQKWFLLFLSEESRIILSGFLELTNGCHLLYKLPNEGLRFISGSCFLSFGGICVLTQTVGVTKDVGIGMYFPGKLLQTSFSFLLASSMQHLILSSSERYRVAGSVIGVVLLSTAVLVLYLYRKKVVAFRRNLLYNTGKI